MCQFKCFFNSFGGLKVMCKKLWYKIIKKETCIYGFTLYKDSFSRITLRRFFAFYWYFFSPISKIPQCLVKDHFLNKIERYLYTFKQWCGSELIVAESGSTKFDEYESGSGSSPDPGQYNHHIDFKTSYKNKKKLTLRD